MSIDQFPVGQEMEITYPGLRVRLAILGHGQLSVEMTQKQPSHVEVVDLHVVPLGANKFILSWRQKNCVVTSVHDYDRNLAHTSAVTNDGAHSRATGSIAIVRPARRLSDDRPERNKALVLEAMTSLFQRHDASAVERLYASNYIQHNPNVPQGRDALKLFVTTLPSAVYYEPGLIIAEGSFVAIHGRMRGWAEVPQIVIDLFRIEEGRLAEHWDVLQDELPTEGAFAMFSPMERALTPADEGGEFAAILQGTSN